MTRVTLAVVLIIAASGCVIAADLPAIVSQEQDGIKAELSVTSSEVQLRWRFVKLLSQPLDQVTATFNGRPLGVPVIEPYPASGGSTAVIALLDISALQREEQIERFKMAMLLLASRKAAHVQMAFAVYALEGSMLVPPSDDPKETLRLLAQIPPLDEEANLSGALISAFRTLATLPVERRAVYIFTDGHNDSSIPLKDLTELALAAPASVFFLIAPSDRAADVPALSRFAEMTGGQLIDDKALPAFLAEPFTLLDSGAQLSFPLVRARKFFWESEGNLQVVMRYGDKQLALKSMAAVTSATPGETLIYVWQDHAAGVAATGGLIVLALGGVGLLGLRRSSIRQEQPASALGKSAELQDVHSGTVYPLRSPLVRIGRSGDNDIVVDEITVGRSHAIIQQISARAFTITDQTSENGTLVNNANIETATLRDGDVISIGTRILRFSLR